MAMIGVLGGMGPMATADLFMADCKMKCDRRTA